MVIDTFNISKIIKVKLLVSWYNFFNFTLIKPYQVPKLNRYSKTSLSQKNLLTIMKKKLQHALCILVLLLCATSCKKNRETDTIDIGKDGLSLSLDAKGRVTSPMIVSPAC